MVDFTFLEVHLHDSPVTANAPFSGEATVNDDEDGEDSEEEAESAGGGLPLKPLVALVVVVVAAVAAKKLLSGDEVEVDADIEAE